MVHRSESELVVDDILFEKRNKSYGAYAIRNVYNTHLRKAILISGVLFTTAMVSPKIVKLFESKEAPKEEFKITEVVLTEPPPIDPKTTPPPPPPQIEQPAPPKIASTKFLPPKIEEDHKVVEEEAPPTQEELKESNPGEVTQEGENENLNEVITTGSGNGVVGEPVDQVFTTVTEQSAYKGNFSAFLNKNLKYPNLALKKEVQGKVVVKFVVDKEGNISDITLVKGLGSGCDEEAKRVIMLTNKQWTVAKNNGVPVKAWHYQEIAFKMQFIEEE